MKVKLDDYLKSKTKQGSLPFFQTDSRVEKQAHNTITLASKAHNSFPELPAHCWHEMLLTYECLGKQTLIME